MTFILVIVDKTAWTGSFITYFLLMISNEILQFHLLLFVAAAASPATTIICLFCHKEKLDFKPGN